MFLQHVEQDVSLRELKEVYNSCYFDEKMRFCAILVKVNCDKLVRLLGGNFMLEIWSDGELVF